MRGSATMLLSLELEYATMRIATKLISMMLYAALAPACLDSLFSRSLAWNNQYCNMKTFRYWEKQLGYAAADSYMWKNYGCSFAGIQGNVIQNLQTEDGARALAGNLMTLMGLAPSSSGNQRSSPTQTPTSQNRAVQQKQVNKKSTGNVSKASDVGISSSQIIAFANKEKRQYACTGNNEKEVFVAGLFDYDYMKVPNIKIGNSVGMFPFTSRDESKQGKKYPIRVFEWVPSSELAAKTGYKQVIWIEDFNSLTAEYKMIDINGATTYYFSCSAMLSA